MKKSIFRAVILSIALFFTNSVFAIKKDSLVTKEFNVFVAGGSRLDFNGVYFTGGLSYSKNKMQYSLQYSYFGYNRININNVNGFLEKTSSGTITIGYKIPIHKFCILINVGPSFGKGVFKGKSDSYNNGYLISDYTTYLKTDYCGLLLNATAKYNIANKIDLGLSFTTNLNYYFKYNPYHQYNEERKYSPKYIENFYGLQLSFDYKLMQKTKKRGSKVKEKKRKTVSKERKATNEPQNIQHKRILTRD